MLWIHDITLLYTDIQLWPFYEKTAHGKVNAFARFVIYYGLLLSLLKKDTHHAMIAIGIALAATLFWDFTQPPKPQPKPPVPEEKPTEELVTQDVSTSCPKLSVHNPMGNPILGVHNNTVNNQCTVDPVQANNLFLRNLPTDHWDIYGKNNSQRQFYTVPVNDQSAFAKWLYDPDIVMRCDKTQKAC